MTPKKRRNQPLNDKQKRFILEYLIDFNATQAAIRAGYSAKTAGSQAHKLLLNPEIQAAIRREQEKTANRLTLTREKVLEQYARIAFSDSRAFFDKDGRLLPVPELDDDASAALQSYEVEMRLLDGPDQPPVPVLKVRWADRRAALDSIMRAQGWNMPDKHELTGKDGGAIEQSVRVVVVPPKEQAEVSVKPLERDDFED